MICKIYKKSNARALSLLLILKMGKKKGMSASVKRQRDKLRKREMRQRQLLSSTDDPQDGSMLESAVPCGTVEGAVSAPPGNFPGQGSIGFPPIEEKPLARMQASLREKMHSNALSIASSQGSRLCARNGGMAPSPDSPPWVCTPPRVPEPDTVHVSGSAGQAQLDMSSSQGDESSRILKDAMDFETDFKTDFKTDIETDIEMNIETNMRMDTDTNMRMNTDTNMRMDTDTNMRTNTDTNMRMDTDTNMRMDTDTNVKMNTDENMKMNTERNVINVQEQNECINDDYIENDSSFRFERQYTGKLIDAEFPSASESRQQADIKKSIQGSFHQGNLMFGENAGTQCVANSLVALAYHKLKNSKHWQATDMDNVLVMGDELYTFLQRSSCVNSRYLLVNELPQFFECFNTVYELKADESLCSLINLSDTEPNYDDFHAYFLLDALHIALSETDGCFVCFRGNTFLIGKTNDQFFTFDSHSRTAEGYMSVNGCSTRILHESIEDVYNHVLSLALSMGYSEMIDCEITGVKCSIRKIEADKKQNGMHSSSNLQLVPDDDVEVVSTESHKISFRPLSADKKIDLCETLGISLSNYEEVREPTVFIQEAEGPENCSGKKVKGFCGVDKKLRAAKLKYWTDRAFRLRAISQRKERYRSNEVYNAKETVKQKSAEKYKKDQIHRADVKKRSTEKYKKDEEHRADVKRRSTDKYKKDGEHRADVKRRSTDKYKKDGKHRADVKRRSTDKYKKDEDHRYMLKAASKVKYHCSADGKKRKKENVLKQRQAMKVKLEDEDEVVKLFKENVRNGPEYTCCCCHRLLFENQVQGCTFEMYEKNQKAMEIAKICINNTYVHECTMSCSTQCKKSSLWICFTCHRKILSGKIPGEAAANKMTLEEIPHQLSNLNSLEQHLIALHIPFMKVMSLPQGGQRNVHGPVVCVPSNMRKATSLPRNESENMLLRVKLKRKLSYKGYFEYQFVNSEHIHTALDYLKKNNRWYQDVVINCTWKQNCEEGDLILNGSNECEEEELRSEQTESQEVVSDTCLQPVDIAQEVLDHYFDDVYNIAPGEGQNPVRMLQEEGNEAKTFPHLFPSGNFSWNENREEKITLARYFNNRLMNTDNRFAKDTNYIFFSQYMSELNQVIEKTQISVRKSVSQLNGGKSVTSDMLQDPEVLSNLLRNNEALRFMQPIRGTPAYWSATQKDLFAMLRQLGIPTWFCSFSAAEFRWNDIVGSILRHENDTTDPSDLDWAEKSEILRKNPVTVARMFENRFHIFQRDVILSPSNPIGNVIDYFIRVEFQQRGSPHMHCLYWVENAPKFNIDSDETVCDFIDRYVTCALPTDNENPELRQIVLAVQQHSKSHSKSCRKKGTECRFNFPRPPSEKTFITKQCEEEDDISDDDGILNKSQAKDILLSVWNEVLDDVNALKTTEEIFSNIHLTQDVYEIAHKLLSTRTSTILRRNPNEMWTNQYNPCLLRCWDANMDIQYVLDPFSCIVYIISYISKSEREMGMLLKQTQVEAIEGNLSARQTMRTIGSAYLNQREVSAQEAVYRVCNLRMKESSRKVVFVPVGENPTRLSKPLSQMQNKERKECNDENFECDDDEDIWMTNIVERYENRPDLHLFDKMCLAEFCSYYRVLAKSQIPKGENENVYELKNGKGYIQKRTRGKPAVIRYPRFNPENTPEKYYQSVLQLFLPYVTQDQLKPPGFEFYQTFFETGFVRLKSEIRLQPVKTLVEGNQSKFSKNEDAIDNAQEVFELYGEPEDAWAKLCPETEMNRKECLDEKKATEKLEDKKPEVTHEIENNSSDLLYHITENSNSRQEMLPLLRRLNEKQKEVFYIVRDWCLKKVNGENMEPLHIFVTGGAGTGKSHLIKVIHYEASRILEKLLSSPDDVSVLLTSFTGTAAFNIRGNTLHHAFSLPIALRIPYEPLNEQNLSAIRSKLEKLQILVIDEISMVHKRLLYYIHERLVQIKKCKEPFGGVSILAVGDFYQLPPVKQRKAERLYNENEEYPVDYWLDFFKMVELDEIMRQREDANFASILNSLRIRTIEEPLSQKAKVMLSECIRDGPEDVLHVYPTNEEANEHNLKILKEKCGDLIEVNAEDYQKDRTTGKLTLREKPFIRTRTDGLSSSLLISVNARVMLTRNINVDDGLVNGAMGHISSIEFGKGEQRNRVEGIGVIFDSKDTGRKEGKFTPQGHLVYIQRVQEDIREKNTKNVVRRQFPLKLSWACTAHKVQGMTTNSVVVNLDRTFAPGQAYVAISRVTSQNGLFIETSNENALQKKIYADQDVKSALSKMQKLISNQNDANMINSDNHKTIILFNVQSLRGHFQDLQCDSRFLNTNFICLTETWLKGSENVKDFEIQNFEFCHVTREQSYDESVDNFVKLCKSKGGGVGMYKKKNEKTLIHELPQKNIEGMAVELCEENTVLIIIYRPSQLSVRVFLDGLQKVLDYFKEQFSKCIILGDFNEDAKCKGPIQELIESKGFQQKVNFSTTEGGTILDHVYVPELIQAD
ncbi:uncharacterized protein LOC134283815, partial [Saccostrea cucullata]|uniref:uncharacterized protein LOC134283815 n=1 Tax=Saccostrea cuccullata TaxID=36930 RepID=UPI002ED4D02B